MSPLETIVAAVVVAQVLFFAICVAACVRSRPLDDEDAWEPVASHPIEDGNVVSFPRRLRAVSDALDTMGDETPEVHWPRGGDAA